MMYGSSTSIAQVIMMVYALVLARHLGPSTYGIFVANYSLAGVCSFLINWGMDQWLLRQDASTINPSFTAGRILSNKIRYWLVWQVGLMFLAPIAKPDLFFTGLVFFATLDVFLDSCLNTEFAMLNKLGCFKNISIGVILSRVLRLITMLVLVLYRVDSPILFSQARAASTLFTLVLITLQSRPKFGTQKFIINIDLLKQSFSFALSDFLTIIYFQSDTTILSFMAGEKAAGSYAPATGIISALFVIPNTFYFIYMPILSKQVDQNRNTFIKTVRKMFLFLFLSGALLMVGMMIFSQPMISLVLGQKYKATGEILLILSPILFLKSLGFGMAAFLVAVGWQNRRLLPQAMSAGLGVLLNLLIIPFYGIYGTAWVYIASEMFLTLGYGLLLLIWISKQTRTSSSPPFSSIQD